MNFLQQLVFHGILIALLTSCSNYPGSEILVQKVTKSTYTDKITSRGTIEAVNNTFVTCPQNLYRGSIQYLIPEGTFVMEGDTIAIIESRETVNDYEEALKELEVAQSEYNQTMAQLNQQKAALVAQMKSIENSVLISNLDSLQLEYSSPTDRKILKLEIEKAKVQKEKIEKKLYFLVTINQSEMKKKEIMIEKMRIRLDKAREVLEQLVVTIPVSGFVVHETNPRTGTVIMEGDPVSRRTRIVKIPDISEFQVKILVFESDYKRIRKGQDVDFYVEAYPHLSLHGEVIFVSPVGIPVKRRSQIKQFEVLANLDSTGLTLEPGLSAICDIIINRIEDTIVIPVFTIFNEDSVRYVYKMKGRKFIRQPVELAIDNKIEAVIKEGLQPDDVVALQMPSARLISQD